MSVEKKPCLGILVAVSFLLLMTPATVNASTIQLIDSYLPGSAVTLAGNRTDYTYTHDITLPAAGTNTLQAYVDGVLTAGEDYDSSTDTLTSGSLSLAFGNFSTSPSGSNGTFDLVLDYGNLLSSENFQVSFANLAFDVSAISSAGVLTVRIVRTNGAGSVDFLNSVLNVSGLRNSVTPPVVPSPTTLAAVPEPATLLLFGTGLAGLGYIRRRLG